MGLGFAFVEDWPRDTQFTFGGYIVSVIIGVIFYLPVALNESNSNLIFNRSGLFNEVSAFLV